MKRVAGVLNTVHYFLVVARELRKAHTRHTAKRVPMMMINANCIAGELQSTQHLSEILWFVVGALYFCGVL